MDELTHAGKVTMRSGIIFDLLNPQEEDIDINDIAHNLSQICRWNGSTRTFYSVAEHSVKVYELYASRASMGNEFSRKGALACLLHDAEEAYWGDIVQPIKDIYPKIEERLLDLRYVILKHFNTSYITYITDIQKYDKQAREWEWENIVKNSRVATSHPVIAERQFLGIFESLLNK